MIYSRENDRKRKYGAISIPFSWKFQTWNKLEMSNSLLPEYIVNPKPHKSTNKSSCLETKLQQNKNYNID